MKKRLFTGSIILTFIIEITFLIFFATRKFDLSQDRVAVNECMHSIQNNWNNIKDYDNSSEFDYVVLDLNGDVLYKTKSGLSENISDAISHRDTVIDILVENKIVGKLVLYNDESSILESQKLSMIIILIGVVIIQMAIYIGYIAYIDYTMLSPFTQLKGFAERVAGGNLDVPLEMDKQNIFGAFTESFDLMRSELKRARIAEAQAVASKKELVAKLSHDIKTPVASIKATCELGNAITHDEKVKHSYMQIIQKADQINTLVTNLFTATLEELEQLSVDAVDTSSLDIKKLLENSDYLKRSTIPSIPECLIYVDKLRLQQVFDNIFSNSYKYANTEMNVSISKEDKFLKIEIEDYGDGVKEDELLLLKEKYKRGDNSRNIEGVGLGLYISNYFMEKMNGELILNNSEKGFAVIVLIALSGMI